MSSMSNLSLDASSEKFCDTGIVKRVHATKTKATKITGMTIFFLINELELGLKLRLFVNFLTTLP